ncbi:PD-(D/E)XK nuclease family protein [Salinibaculum rarum]|uniref:PD-(D/E)XK nuclease family protein n=1 Tax=Salinibaculum rarum TaxID=3058903 RepID=UPI00265DBA84|nr:PD-(D/E)XK nuclease family protein [Salinibaculum sp. KK48]
MSVRGERLVQGIRECHIDLLVVQLLETSPEFRDWFLPIAADEDRCDVYFGSACNVFGSDGRESDIEVGFQTPDGDEHLVLIENKITASEQPDQFSDYHKRGEQRVHRGDWDEATICLIAPERRVTTQLQAKVDTVVFYEELRDQLQRIDHDAATFGATLLTYATEKSHSPIDDYSATVSNILWTTLDEIGHLADFEVIQNSKKQLKFTSNHPDHPNFLIYSVYIDEGGERGLTRIRLQLKMDDENERRRIAEALITDLHDHSPIFKEDYQPTPDKQNFFVKTVYHEDLRSFPDGVVTAASEEMTSLVQATHPIFCQRDFSTS